VILTLTLLTPLLAFAGASLGVFWNRRGALELESRSVREETMRHTRWAAELALSGASTHWRFAVDQLEAIGRQPELGPFEATMVRIALSTVVRSGLEEA
jgi:hypothetical protein